MKSFFLTVYCQGGLGNQLFQFIIAYILAKKNKIKLRINLDRFNSYDRKFKLDNFPEIKKLCIPKIIKHNLYFKIYLYFYHKLIKILKILRIYNYINSFYFLNQKQFEKSPFIFNKDLLQERIHKNITITGYFQSEKYFINYRKTVLKLFKFPKPNNKLVEDYLHLIKNKNSI